MSFKHLRPFNCRTFVHIPKDEKSKIDVKSRQYIFLNYRHEDFGYRLYDPIEKKVIRNRDVFLENQSIENIDKDNDQQFLASI